ncbi:MAG: NAD+ synthase [Gallionella sp.]|nr:NAD+ synthase [Gallionella sp.]MDD4959366.1 NAD+ synthase [Gallionella sp.]
MMTSLKITLAQINPTIADITGNIELMRCSALQAQSETAQMVIFPELSLTGYSPGDLLDDAAFLARVDNGLEALLAVTKQTPGLYWVVGTPIRRTGAGKPLENSILVMVDGAVVLQYTKQLLPTYNVFDERRHFEPGPDVACVLQIGDSKVGFMICEDGWNDAEQDYAVNPFARLAKAEPDLIVSINASPSNLGKHEQRQQLFTEASRHYALPLIYVNQVGGHDQLVFDGASFVVTPSTGVVFESARFVQAVDTLQWDGDHFSDRDGTLLIKTVGSALPAMEFYRQQIMLGLRDYARRCGFKQVVVGASGGIDSALTIALAVEALGADNVVAITMPSRFSSAGSVSDSQTLCQNLGVTLLEHPIHELVAAYELGFTKSYSATLQGTALENLQARIRGTLLMEYSNAFGHLVLTTGNKSEISVGYCTLYGDTNGGLALIGDLYKTEVFELCRHLNVSAGRELIPRTIIEKTPSAELAPGQRDDDSLPPYEVLDVILKMLIEGTRLGKSERESVEKKFASLTSDEAGRTLINRIKTMIARNEYKRRQAAPILRLRAVAFGNGRQMPIAAKYD